jgi:nucleoside-diphosphate-sugar epimerase
VSDLLNTSMSSKMNIAVTGATGYLGGLFCKLLKINNVPFITINRGATIGDMESTLSNLKNAVVVHFASLFVAEHKPADVSRLIESNILFGSQVLQAMQSANVKKIVTAGSAWQDGRGVAKPANFYAATKNAFEDIVKLYCASHDFSAISLRIYDTAGPNDPRGKLFTALAKKINTTDSFDLSAGEQKLHLIHSDDVAAAFYQASQTLMNTKESELKVYELRREKIQNLKELVAQFQKQSNGKPQVNWGKKPYRECEVLNPIEDHTVLPGWKPTRTIEQIFSDVISSEVNRAH